MKEVERLVIVARCLVTVAESQWKKWWQWPEAVLESVGLSRGPERSTDLCCWESTGCGRQGGRLEATSIPGGRWQEP